MTPEQRKALEALQRLGVQAADVNPSRMTREEVSRLAALGRALADMYREAGQIAERVRLR